MAAIDYTVCLHSEVFVTTQGGNFPHFLLGHRRYLYGGHSKTIKPDKRKLALLFDNPNIGWRSFKRQLLTMRSHSDSKGIELKRPNDSIYSFPCPDCMCRANRTANRTNDSKSSSAAWSTQSLKCFCYLWFCEYALPLTAFLIRWLFHFLSPSHLVRRHIRHFWRSKDFVGRFIVLIIYLDSISREWVTCFMQMMLIHFRTEWKMFLCRNLSQNIEWAMFRTWISSFSIEQAV